MSATPQGTVRGAYPRKRQNRNSGIMVVLACPVSHLNYISRAVCQRDKGKAIPCIECGTYFKVPEVTPAQIEEAIANWIAQQPEKSA